MCGTVGDIISVIDHVNVSARNPLYGHQIQGWGVRFPDMSTIYTKTELDNVKAVSVAQHVGPLFYSPVEAALAREVSKCAVSSTGLGYNTIVAKHVNPELSVVGLGLVTGSQLVNTEPLTTAAVTPFIEQVATFCKSVRS